ncbi:MAG TPA: hypothetical protein VM621_17060 [Luteibacter sp.]|uniref:hypothetical protein n=1 Tax=Luteibacter sp. TaxID=1886636 RepID=UPI002CE01E08|nr:hypothetical protein [Luteibacter sp.]HVI56753.1 hypothetical protein [Luteibacter sp.]
MKWLLRSPATYIAWPLLLACAVTWLAYDLPAGYLQGMSLLMMAAGAIVLVDTFAGIRLPSIARVRARDYTGSREALVALVFAAVVILFCGLDLALFPVPLLDNPASYATMEPGREHVRHISSLCWTLPPIGLLCTRQRGLRNALIIVGLVFPVLVIDRNRIFAALFSFALVILFRRDERRPLPWKSIGVIGVLGATVFSVLGAVRSGSLDNVALPFSPLYLASPQGIKWLVLYVSAGPYNFASMVAKGYTDTSLLIGQLVPQAGPMTSAPTDIPFDAANINVGTEFLPFLLAFGPLGAVASMFLLYALLVWSVRRLRASVSLFSLLIFLRVAYVCVMSPFAPQAFIWTNGAFIVLCLSMQLCAALLPSRRGGLSLSHSTEPHAWNKTKST